MRILILAGNSVGAVGRLYNILIALVLLNAAPSPGATNYVSPDGGHTAPFASWPDAATNIQSAINAAPTGGVVVVGDGTYRPDTTIAISNGITLQSLNGAGRTVIDAQGSRRCIAMTNATIRGFTVTGGYTYLVRGAGIHCMAGLIADCRIVSNRVHGGVDGGGIYCGNSVVTNCDIAANDSVGRSYAGFHGEWYYEAGMGGGIACVDDSRVIDCGLFANTAHRGAAAYMRSGSIVSGCRVERNRSGLRCGVELGDRCIVERSIIRNNPGGGVFMSRGGLLRSCLVVGNHAHPVTGISGDIALWGWSSGGGVNIWFSGVVENCTVTENDNAHDGNAGGIGFTSGGGDSLEIRNSIVYGNTGGNIDPPAVSAVRYSCIETDEPPFAFCAGNITNPPQFLGDPEFHLSPASPCIDAGTNSLTAGADTDIDGHPRINGAAVDMGAAEFGELFCSFSADPSTGISAFEAPCTSYVSGTNMGELYFRWDFDGDGVIDAEGNNLQSTSHCYAAIGTYSVGLSVSNSAGKCAGWQRRDYIRVLPPLVADFGPVATGAAPFAVTFEDTSSEFPQFWFWDFDSDGSVDSTRNAPTHVFVDPGRYTVTLTVSNDFGAGGSSADTVMKTNCITVLPAIVAAFSTDKSPQTNAFDAPIVVAPEEPIQFYDKSRHSPTSWYWLFNYDTYYDSEVNVHRPTESSTNRNPVHCYSYGQAGLRNVGLWVANRYSSAWTVSNAYVLVVDDTPYHYVRESNPSPEYPYASWRTAATNIQHAIDAADSGNTVLVSNGTYRLATTVRITKDIVLRSVSGPAATIVDGGGSNRCFDIWDSGSVVCGFTITNGYDTDSGGGVLAVGRRYRLIDCVVVGNTAARGGGACLQYSTGGVALIENCLFLRNTAELGGGIYSAYGPGISHCTILENTATIGGGGLYVDSSTPVRNSIIYFNTAPASPNAHCISGARLESCCTTPHSLALRRCFTNEPGFVDRSGGNYRLMSNSPCIDSGMVLADTTPDFGGVPRPLDGNNDGRAEPDMGVYEFMHESADSDGDGLIDTNEWFGTGTNPAGSDTDGDRARDGDELIAGTDPLDSDSCLRLDTLTPRDGWLLLKWRTVYGMAYRVQRSTNLASGIWNDVWDFPIYELDEYPEGTESIFHPIPDHRAPVYYRIRLD